MGVMGGMGADGRYAGRMGPATSRGNRQKKKNIRKRKKSKRKTSEKEKAEEDGGFIYSGRFCHSLYIIHGQEHVGTFFH